VHLCGESFQNACEDVVDRVLLGGVAVPDGDEVGVEADGKTNAAELVLCKKKGVC
jgi:hypothetical protein